MFFESSYMNYVCNGNFVDIWKIFELKGIEKKEEIVNYNIKCKI